MVTAGQLRGMLLEEAVLHLLQRSGYRTIDEPGDDPTLCTVGAGIAVRGRGCEHQIDSIADFLVRQPFSNPQRLFVEAKCYASESRVGIDVVRNAVGVLKDASEYWVSGPMLAPGRSRYHYQYAIFAASEFSAVAQRYAFAQDVHLFPLGRSSFLRPVLRAIRAIDPLPGQQELSNIRRDVRAALRHSDAGDVHHRYRSFVAACLQLNYSLVVVFGGRFPVLLAPSEQLRERDLPPLMQVRIHWDRNGWYLRSQRGEDLFSFDLPSELFELYAEDRYLSARQALNLKEDVMSDFQAIEVRHGSPRIIRFVLDQDWIERIRRGTRQRRDRRA